ncbi:MAG TPA: DUF192 domain-containing protein [Acidimicrobiales bacterium]|nr:DUF192 domain-containing protein [Acidimicrobiales bacterium]
MTRRSLVLAAALGLAVAAGCGGGDGAGDAAGAADPVVTTAGPTTTAGPSTSERVTTTSAPDGEVLPEGFAAVAAVVVTGAGERLDRCVLVADTPELRRQGLMEVTSLGAADGMVFVFDADTTGGFWMRNTRIPLSIAFLDAEGAIVSTADMAPCPDGEDCPTYPPDGPYRLALEVPQGELASFGLVDDARLEVVGGACGI